MSSLLSIQNLEVKNRSIIATVIILLCFTGFFTERRLKYEIETTIQNSLEQSLRSNAEAITLLLGSYKEDVNSIAQIPNLKAYSQYLLNAQESEKEAVRNNLDEIMKVFFTPNGFKNYYLISKEGKIISSMDRALIGHVVDNAGDIESKLDSEGTFVGLPKHFVDLKTGEESIVMYIGASLKDRNNQTYAYIAVKILPEDNFSRVMWASAQIGESSETYAINPEGWMISSSRFDEQLKAEGIISQDSKSAVLKVRLVDKEDNPLRFYEDVLNNSQSHYPNVTIDTKGYHDYRAFDVIGCWTYLPQFGFAMTSEIDHEEAFRPLTIIRQIFGVLFGLAALMGAGIIYYAFRTLKLKKRIRSAALDAAHELGQFQIVSKIGEGAMGAVYRAKHKLMQRDTAVKVLKNEVCRESDFLQFEKEVKTTCRLSNPNTICIYDYGRTREGLFYYAMEYLEGSDIQEVIAKTGPISPSRVVDFLKQICSSLNEAHEMGLVHRDIKAQNIMICNRGGVFDLIKVLDFGLVLDSSDEPDQIKVSGTPRYMAPEATNSPNKIDPRADIYALGVLISVMLTGNYPFSCDDKVEAILKAHREDAPKKPSDLVKFSIPESLDELVLWCLEKDPHKRPQTVIEIVDRLNTFDIELWDQEKAMKWWRLNAEYFDSTEGVTLGPSRQFDQTIQFDRFDKTIQSG